MFWSTINVDLLSKDFLPTFFRQAQAVAHNEAYLSALQTTVDQTLYKMQHNGTKIYLEKLLNEAYNVDGYNANFHEATKKIYIEDIEPTAKLYIFQDEEAESLFLEDDGDDNEDDVFLEDGVDETSASWVVYMPDNISFVEVKLRALIDSYRYIGKKYLIEIYEI